MRELNLVSFVPRSYVNGPGARAVIWVQGCPLACPGCFNPHTHSTSPRHLIPVDRLAERIRGIEKIEGVTFSGGEPFAQAEPLAELARALRRDGLSIMSYSGHTIEHIRGGGDPAKLDLLSQLDLLVDGPFIQARQQALLWRGSANQRVHFLTPRYRHLKLWIAQTSRRVEVTLHERGRLTVTGFPNDGERRELQDRLAEMFGLRLSTRSDDVERSQPITAL